MRISDWSSDVCSSDLLGIGDVEPTAANIDVTGNALKPIAPVHFRMVSDGAGGLMIGWNRRSRAGWAWQDFVDAPLGEEFERYRLRVCAGGELAIGKV